MNTLGIHISRHATALPAGKPRTDDMREMVEKLTEMGMIQKAPAAFRYGNKIVMHPVLYERIKNHRGVSIAPFNPFKFQGWTT